MTTKASAVLLSHGRPDNVPLIVERLLDQPFVDDVVVWHQGTVRLPSDVAGRQPENVTVHYEENQYTWGRFLACDRCRHDAIVTQDDDVLLHNWPEVWEAFVESPVPISCAMPKGHQSYHSGPRCKTSRSHEVLLGWGAVFSKWRMERAVQRYNAFGPRDELFDRKADRILSALWGCEHKIIRADFDELPGARDENALWRQPDHNRLTQQARQRVKDILDVEDATK